MVIWEDRFCKGGLAGLPWSGNSYNGKILKKFVYCLSGITFNHELTAEVSMQYVNDILKLHGKGVGHFTFAWSPKMKGSAGKQNIDYRATWTTSAAYAEDKHGYRV